MIAALMLHREKLLVVNRKGNYTAHGLENRAAYDKYLQRNGDIVPGEIVLCRDIIRKLTTESEQSITITIDPWKYERVYTFGEDESGTACTPRKRARMVRWEPSLDDYEREEISDTVP